MRIPPPQLACLSVLFLTVIVCLPGLYYETELPGPSRGTSMHVPFPVREVSRRAGIRTLAEWTHQDTSASRLTVRTPFELRELSRAARRAVERRIRVDVNRSSASRLTDIEGVGPVTADRIVRRRRRRGPFETVRDLLSVSGIGPITLRELTDDIVLSGRLVEPGNRVVSGSGPLDINRASARQLTSLPGIGPVLAGRIIDVRNRDGPLQNEADLDRIKGIGPNILTRLRNRVEY